MTLCTYPLLKTSYGNRRSLHRLNLTTHLLSSSGTRKLHLHRTASSCSSDSRRCV